MFKKIIGYKLTEIYSDMKNKYSSIQLLNAMSKQLFFIHMITIY